MKNENEHNEGKSAIATLIVALLFFGMCFFISCWEAPGPPWPDSPTGMTLSLGSITGSTETGSPQPEAQTPQETLVDENEIVGSDIENDVHVAETEQSVVNDITETNQENSNPSTNTNQSQSNDNSQSETQSTDTPPLYTNTGDAAGDPEGNPEDGDPEGNTPLYTGGSTPGEGDGKGKGGNGLSMDSWGWNSVPDTKKVKHQGTIKVKIVVDDEGNITSITFPFDSGAFDVDDKEAIKEAIRRSGVKAKNSSVLPPESEEGIATFIIKR